MQDPTTPPELAEAQKKLGRVAEDAREENHQLPSELAFGNARRLLSEMYEISPRFFDIYSMPDGEIAIDAPGGFGQSVTLLCEPDGGALCLVTLGDEHRRARYSTARTLPDGFVREALAELEDAAAT